MFGHDEFLQRFQLCFRRFEKDQYLRVRLQFALPPVMRLNFWNQIGAGDEARLEGGPGQKTRRLEFRSADDHNCEWSTRLHRIPNLESSRFIAFMRIQY